MGLIRGAFASVEDVEEFQARLTVGVDLSLAHSFELQQAVIILPLIGRRTVEETCRVYIGKVFLFLVCFVFEGHVEEARHKVHLLSELEPDIAFILHLHRKLRVIVGEGKSCL